jgi:hypothetical protein
MFHVLLKNNNMKEIVQGAGVRLYKGEDFLTLQQSALGMMERFFAQYGNFIIYGCEPTNPGLAPGVVMLDGKACVFEGESAGITCYVKKIAVNENVPYKTGDGVGFTTYIAQQCLKTDTGAWMLSGGKTFQQATQVQLPKKNALKFNIILNSWGSGESVNFNIVADEPVASMLTTVVVVEGSTDGVIWNLLPNMAVAVSFGIDIGSTTSYDFWIDGNPLSYTYLRISVKEVSVSIDSSFIYVAPSFIILQ